MRRDLRRALCPGAWQEASATHRGLMVGGSPFALTVQPGPTELGRCELVAAAEGTRSVAVQFSVHGQARAASLVHQWEKILSPGANARRVGTTSLAAAAAAAGGGGAGGTAGSG